MGKPTSTQYEAAQRDADPQPPVLKELLRSLNTARRQSSLYGCDHPNTQKFVEELTQAIANYLECCGASTLIFAEEALIANDIWYQPSGDSREMCQRLRSRGTIAITIVAEPPPEHVAEFLIFLNAEPKDVRAEGGPSAYLRRKSVSRIVATEAVYVSGDESETDNPNEFEGKPMTTDRAMLAMINWLTEHDDDGSAPRVRTSDLLGDPEMASKFIHEAVTKLHASRRSRPARENDSDSATEVMNQIKALSVADHDGWDKSLPQVRKAVSKLPPELRPSVSGFTNASDLEGGRGAGARPRKQVDVGRVEGMIVKALYPGDEVDTDLQMKLSDIEELFDASPSGMLSTWTSELRPQSALKRQGRTLAMLLVWETNSAEHGHLARCLALLIPLAIEIKEIEIALELAACLVDEANAQGQLPWRVTNAKHALQIVEESALAALMEEALRTNDSRYMETAALLVEAAPAVALSSLHVLRQYPTPGFAEAVKRAITRAGRSAAPGLGKLIMEGSDWERKTALEILVDVKADWATGEIARALQVADPAFCVEAISSLPEIGGALAVQICIEMLGHESSDVRCAALHALGALGDESTLTHLIRFATKYGFRIADHREQMAAVEALGALGSSDATPCLERIAGRRRLFWPSRNRMLRQAAQQAMGRIVMNNAEISAEAA